MASVKEIISSFHFPLDATIAEVMKLQQNIDDKFKIQDLVSSSHAANVDLLRRLASSVISISGSSGDVILFGSELQCNCRRASKIVFASDRPSITVQTRRWQAWRLILLKTFAYPLATIRRWSCSKRSRLNPRSQGGKSTSCWQLTSPLNPDTGASSSRLPSSSSPRRASQMRMLTTSLRRSSYLKVCSIWH